tara:strand:+ start:314 stop:547 length:234 start_codon:yes stop_codon:yes gene_type:complete
MVTVNLNSQSIRAAFQELCDERDSGNMKPDFMARFTRASLLMGLVLDAEFAKSTGIALCIDGSGEPVKLTAQQIAAL